MSKRLGQNSPLSDRLTGWIQGAIRDPAGVQGHMVFLNDILACLKALEAEPSLEALRVKQIERLTWSSKALQPIDELLSTIPSDTARKAVQIVRQVAFEVGTVREQLEKVAEINSLGQQEAHRSER